MAVNVPAQREDKACGPELPNAGVGRLIDVACGEERPPVREDKACGSEEPTSVANVSVVC